MAQAHKFRKAKSLFSTTLSAGIGTGTGETITLASVTGLPTDTEITITIDRVDSAGTATPNAMERITGIISGSNLISYTRAIDGTSDVAHSSGAVVEYIWNADDLNDLVDGLLVGHNQDGTHDFATLYDTNGNEQIKLTATASAVNEITVTNAATGNAPEISATGGDTNIGITLTPKGTGALTVGGNTFRHGAWASWAVSWTNVSIGNAAVSARYAQIGKTIIGHLSFALGSTTSISGNVTFSLPVAGTNDAFASSVFIGTCYAEDNGSAGYTAFIRQVSTTTASPVLATTGAFFAATAPFTWAENDYFRCSFMYEAA